MILISNCFHFCNLTFFLGANKDKKNSINATTIILGPDAVLNSKELNKPITTEEIPPKIDRKTICLGLLLRFLAIAGGIISKPVINRTPIIFIDIAITPAKSNVNIIFDLSGCMPSAAAKS